MKRKNIIDSNNNSTTSSNQNLESSVESVSSVATSVENNTISNSNNSGSNATTNHLHHHNISHANNLISLTSGADLSSLVAASQQISSNPLLQFISQQPTQQLQVDLNGGVMSYFNSFTLGGGGVGVHSPALTTPSSAASSSTTGSLTGTPAALLTPVSAGSK